jgi:hypothetical protein
MDPSPSSRPLADKLELDPFLNATDAWCARYVVAFGWIATALMTIAAILLVATTAHVGGRSPSFHRCLRPGSSRRWVDPIPQWPRPRSPRPRRVGQHATTRSLLL